jgi:hypothetical protein
MRPCGRECVCVDMGASVRTHCRVRADAVFTASADGKNPSADVRMKRTSGR